MVSVISSCLPGNFEIGVALEQVFIQVPDIWVGGAVRPLTGVPYGQPYQILR